MKSTLDMLASKFGATMSVEDAAGQLGVAETTLLTSDALKHLLTRTMPSRKRSPRMVFTANLAEHLDSCYMASL